MVFSSTIFLFGFLPLFLAVYFLMPWRPAKNVFLLLASLVFYAWGEPVYVLLMMGSIVFNWLAALLIQGSNAKPARKAWLVFDLVANIAVLGFFKYADFAIENVNAVIGEQFLASLELDLPIGISFFTLQAISYVVDVYRDKVKAQLNILYLGMYIAMFPQLVAGPIVRYSQIEEQIGSRRVTLVGLLKVCACSPSDSVRRRSSRTRSPSLRMICSLRAHPPSASSAVFLACSLTRSRYTSTSPVIRTWPSALGR